MHNGQVNTSAQWVCEQIAREIDRIGFGAHGLHVRVGGPAGDTEAAHRWQPDVREEIHSVSKAVCVLAAALAEAEGKVSLDAPLASYVDGVAFGAGVGDRTLRHLLTMSSGIDLPWSETMMTDWPDLAHEFLGRDAAGHTFQYSNASSYAAMWVLAGCVGDVLEYAQTRLFDPIGIPDVTWARCPNGRVLAGEGIALRTEEMARLGRLIRDRGVWGGRQLVPAAAVDAMHSDWRAAGDSPGYERYAMAGWDGPGDAWRLHGAYGQLVILRGDAVVTVSAHDHFGADGAAAAIVEVLARRDERPSR